MPSLDLGDMYFKVSTSAAPTDFDKVGCDGLYIKEVVRVTSTNNARDEICRSCKWNGNKVACALPGHISGIITRCGKHSPVA